MTPGPLQRVTPPLDGREFRWSVGTRPIPESEWLEVSATTTKVMAEKADLLARIPAEVVVSEAGTEDACNELLENVLAHLQMFAPDRFAVSSDEKTLRDRLLGREVTLRNEPAVSVLGQLVAEDFCLLEPKGEAWAMTAATVCFPSRWRLSDKLGQDLADIHQPVPGYESRIGGAVEALFNRLTPENIVSRSNWTLLNTNERHLPTAESSPKVPVMADLGWVRIERQTIRKLADSGAIVFTILTRVIDYRSLSSIDQAAMARAVVSAPADIAHYKSWPQS
ncbi:MAG: DUF3445 domain-containing protein [Actinobacteria bacterium]|nr:DUF3445 domain-containing protein [Actinomycetota bacterium]